MLLVVRPLVSIRYTRRYFALSRRVQLPQPQHLARPTLSATGPRSSQRLAQRPLSSASKVRASRKSGVTLRGFAAPQGQAFITESTALRRACRACSAISVGAVGARRRGRDKRERRQNSAVHPAPILLHYAAAAAAAAAKPRSPLIAQLPAVLPAASPAALMKVFAPSLSTPPLLLSSFAERCWLAWLRLRFFRRALPACLAVVRSS